MTKSNRIAALIAAPVLALASLAMAGGGILFPTWSAPSKGTYDAPAAEVGKKAAESTPWSATTVEAAIQGKALAGTPTTVVGEIVDLSCYLQVGKHGEKHKDCGTKCVKNGAPIGLLAKDGAVYLLIEEEHHPRRDGKTDFRDQAAAMMAEVVSVNGTMTDVEGHKTLYVQGFVKK